MSSTAQLNDRDITINILAIPTTATPVFNSAFVSATFFTATINLSCDQEVFVYFFAMPKTTYKEHTSATVKSWVLAGYRVIDRDTIIG